MIDILTCLAPHEHNGIALLTSALPSLIPSISSSSRPVQIAWLHLLVTICQSSQVFDCVSAARNGALDLPIRLIKSGTVQDILAALHATLALAQGALSHPTLSELDNHAEDCLLCRSGALQAMIYIMRTSSDATYFTLASSVCLIQCRYVSSLSYSTSPSPLLTLPSSNSHSAGLGQQQHPAIGFPWSCRCIDSSSSPAFCYR
jgi:hypothetical protein